MCQQIHLHLCVSVLHKEHFTVQTSLWFGEHTVLQHIQYNTGNTDKQCLFVYRCKDYNKKYVTSNLSPSLITVAHLFNPPNPTQIQLLYFYCLKPNEFYFGLFRFPGTPPFMTQSKFGLNDLVEHYAKMCPL